MVAMINNDYASWLEYQQRLAELERAAMNRLAREVASPPERQSRGTRRRPLGRVCAALGWPIKRFGGGQEAVGGPSRAG